MTVGDALSIIVLYQRIFSTTNKKIVDSADEFVVNRDTFCKFVDPEFQVDDPSKKWSVRTKAAASLYHSVLDVQQRFVTLGQVRKTINVLISDLTDKIKSGELIRLINHIERKKQEDMAQYGGKDSNDRVESNDKVQQKFTQKFTHTWCSSVRGTQQNVFIAMMTSNSSLQFNHIGKGEWIKFLNTISDHLHHNIPSHKVHSTLHGMRANDDTKHSFVVCGVFAAFSQSGCTCLQMGTTRKNRPCLIRYCISHSLIFVTFLK